MERLISTLADDIHWSRSSLPDPQSPNLETVREAMMAHLRLLIRSNADSEITIFTVTEGGEHEEEHYTTIVEKYGQ
jgi:hypothetical protein